MRNKLKKTDNKGFTIIEVMIVLAIAGLILLIVFLAVPALQRNSRNTQRKNDVQALLGSLSEYASNNAGAIPASCSGTSGTCFVKDAKLSSYDNATANVSFTKKTTAGNTTNPNDLDKITIVSFSKCSAGNAVGTNASSRNVVALYTIESSSGKIDQCQET